jgi:hypothetical protein
VDMAALNDHMRRWLTAEDHDSDDVGADPP